MSRFIDLSIPIENDVPSDPKPFGPKVTYMAHGETFEQIATFFPGLRPEDLPDQEGWAVEQVTLSTHNGTHMDAPWHFHSTQDAALPGGSRRSLTIDELPLDWCMRPGVKLDFRAFYDGYVATAADVEAELGRIGHTLRPYDIVVVNTRAGLRYGHDDYVSSGCGMGREATLYLAERGVKIVGTDAWSWDAPFVHTAKRWAERRDPQIIWEGHKAGREIGYFQIEKLHNLERLPPTGFTLCCFPVKIKAASAGWIRGVAILDGDGVE
jgi:kynurenine formamidase